MRATCLRHRSYCRHTEFYFTTNRLRLISYTHSDIKPTRTGHKKLAQAVSFLSYRGEAPRVYGGRIISYPKGFRVYPVTAGKCRDASDTLRHNYCFPNHYSLPSHHWTLRSLIYRHSYAIHYQINYPHVSDNEVVDMHTLPKICTICTSPSAGG